MNHPLPDKPIYPHSKTKHRDLYDTVSSLISYLSEKEKGSDCCEKCYACAAYKIDEKLVEEYYCSYKACTCHQSPKEANVPCDCPKGGMDSEGRVCEKCDGTEWKPAPQSTDWEKDADAWWTGDKNIKPFIRELLSRKEAEFIACVPEGIRPSFGMSRDEVEFSDGFNACRAQMLTNLAERK